MNAISFQTDLYAPCFPAFSVDADMTLGERIQFSLSLGRSSIECSMPALQTSHCCILNNTSDPQNDVEKWVDSWKVIENTLVDVISSDGVAIKEGQQFMLTDDQIYNLNRHIEWFVEENFAEEINKLGEDE